MLGAGLLCAGFFVGHFACLYIAMVIFGVNAASGFDPSPTIPQGDTAVFWQSNIWYLCLDSYEWDGCEHDLVCADPAGTTAEKAGRVHMAPPRLLPARDRLWIVASNGVAFRADGRISVVSDRSVGGISCPPFLHGGSPAIVARGPSHSLMLKVLTPQGWETQMEFEGVVVASVERDIRVLSDSGRFHVFRRKENTVFYGEGFPETGPDRAAWEEVGNAPYAWCTLMLDGRPAVFSGGSGRNARIKGVARVDGAWVPILSYDPEHYLEGFCVSVTDEPGTYLLATAGYDGNKLVTIRNGDVIDRVSLPNPTGRQTPMSQDWSMLCVILVVGPPVLLAVLLSFLMNQHRTPAHVAGDHTALFASLVRRGAAHVLDVLICAGFYLPKAYAIATGSVGQHPVLSETWYTLTTISWTVLCCVVLPIMEGRYGVTPGKLLLRIKVLGVDLKPCGIMRAYLRNALRLVDGFLCFMVGIMTSALTARWQRLGDLAAQTVVVDASRKNARPPEDETISLD
jgi:uncharacterized RDD family membrane protein YckC